MVTCIIYPFMWMLQSQATNEINKRMDTLLLLTIITDMRS